MTVVASKSTKVIAFPAFASAAPAFMAAAA
jgi:hypothetical protein